MLPPQLARVLMPSGTGFELSLLGNHITLARYDGISEVGQAFQGVRLNAV